MRTEIKTERGRNNEKIQRVMRRKIKKFEIKKGEALSQSKAPSLAKRNFINNAKGKQSRAQNALSLRLPPGLRLEST